MNLGSYKWRSNFCVSHEGKFLILVLSIYLKPLWARPLRDVSCSVWLPSVGAIEDLSLRHLNRINVDGEDGGAEKAHATTQGDRDPW
jgi:hypothetical protein